MYRGVSLSLASQQPFPFPLLQVFFVFSPWVVWAWWGGLGVTKGLPFYKYVFFVVERWWCCWWWWYHMALPFIPRQCSSPPVDECLWDALAPAVSVFSVVALDVWKHLSTHVMPPVQSSKLSSWFSAWSRIPRVKVQICSSNGLRPVPY